jgi:quercetin dioxygenase-like cupin family protein
MTIPPAISREILLDVRLPATKPVERVEVRRITMGPDVAAGLHVHNGPVFGNIVSGSAVYQVEGGAEVVLTPGDAFYEAEGARIARFDAQGDGVVFIACFPVEPGGEATMTAPDSPVQ